MGTTAAGRGHRDGCKPPPCAASGAKGCDRRRSAHRWRGFRMDFGALTSSAAGRRFVSRWEKHLAGWQGRARGGRKRRRHDKGRLPTCEVSPCFSAGARDKSRAPAQDNAWGTRSRERARWQPKLKVPSPLGAQSDSTGCFGVCTVHRRGVERERAGSFGVKSHFLCSQPFSGPRHTGGPWHGAGGGPSPRCGAGSRWRRNRLYSRLKGRLHNLAPGESEAGSGFAQLLALALVAFHNLPPTFV